ncbi:MAG: O-antigen ligase family protein [Candidatus Rokubacteria bacterium]|nr:O-antigen ligase family protein [Candidatus Rokubacteria bacterium]
MKGRAEWATALLAPGLACAVLTLFLPLKTKVLGLTLRPFDPMLAALIALTLLGGLWRASAVQGLHRDWWFILSGLFAVYLFLNGLLLASSKAAVAGFGQKAEFLLFTATLVGVGADERARERFIRVLVAGLVVIVVGVVLYHVARGKFAGYKDAGEPKWAFGLLASILFPLGFLDRSGARRLGLGLAAVLFTCLTLLSLERKGWVGVAAAGVFALYLSRITPTVSVGLAVVMRRVATLLLIVALGVAAMVLAVPVFVTHAMPFLERHAPAVVAEHIGSINELLQGLTDLEHSWKSVKSAHAGGRLFLLDFSVRKFGDSPLLGVGVKQFQTVISREGSPLGPTTTPHSELLRYAVETGLVGLAFYLSLWAMGVGRALRLADLRLAPRQRTWLLLAGALFAYGASMDLFVSAGSQNEFFLALPVGLTTGLLREATHDRAAAGVGAAGR